MTPILDDDRRAADRLNTAWDAASGPGTAGDPLTDSIRRIHAALEPADPAPAFVAALRRTLVDKRPSAPPSASAARVGLVARPAGHLERPALHRLAAVAALCVILFGAAAVVRWPADTGETPLVASALASREVWTPAAEPTATALISVTALRTIGAPVALWAAPAVGTPTAELRPSTPVELIGQTVGRQSERWLHVRSVDGATGWVRAADVAGGDDDA